VDFPYKEAYISSSPLETMRLGEKIGGLLKPGGIVALKGNLGAGKTVFARGIARALGVTEDLTSPTYTIISEYPGADMNVYHMDAYRLSGHDDFVLAGGEDLLYGGGVCIVEWPERLRLPGAVFSVEIEILEDGKRRIRYGAGP
jgi:tRNA threonylcarbamoyladenosine biosynthesis protein TsaE